MGVHRLCDEIVKVLVHLPPARDVSSGLSPCEICRPMAATPKPVVVS